MLHRFPLRPSLAVGVLAGCLFLASVLSGSAAPRKPVPAPAAPGVDAAFFREKVRPLVVQRCLGCHAGAAPQGELDLSTREGFLGMPARMASPEKHGTMRVLARVQAGTMPPGGKLPAAEIAVLRRWIDGGMPWSGGRIDPLAVTTADRAGLDWWSLQPLRPMQPPADPTAVPEAPPLSRGVDAFVRRRLQQSGKDFAPPAPRALYIRRVTYDLHGLPPTWEEIREFEADRRPDAFERLVDRLLASPRYGERMARRWLDLARFAESDGYEHDMPRLKAWPYRDWVIRAFNEDLPYDRFVREQLAGDALHPEDPQAVVPTGFLVAGGYDSVGAKQAAETFRAEVRQDELDDMIGAVSQVFLGMTAQCARCHDHKYDPIPQRDYYRLQAALAGARHHGAEGKHETYAVRSEPPSPVRLLKRGSVTSPGSEVAPGGLSALSALPVDLQPTPDSDPARRLRLSEWITDPRNPLTPRVLVNRAWGWMFGTPLVGTPNDFGFNGERPADRELLDWLASWFVSGEAENRGEGRGERRESGRPTLSPLASPLSPPGARWSVKALLRGLVLSGTYRQGGAGELETPWRRAPRRLEAEEVRDAMLTVSGSLNLTMGGPGYQLFTWKSNAGALYEPADPEGAEYDRRAIYRMVVRGTEDSLLSGLDCPDASTTTPRRQATTTATQALALLNNRFVDRQSGRLAERLGREAGADAEEDAVRLSYRLALGREPDERETARAAGFAKRHGLKAWCRVLFNTSEFLYVE